MNKLDYTLSELVNMLVTIEETLKSSKSSILAMEQASSFKKESPGKKKVKSTKKQKKKANQRRKSLIRPKQRENIFTVMLKATREGTIQNTWRV